MDPEEQARRRRAIEEARDLLRDLDAAAELRAAHIDLPESEWESDRKYRYGLALARPGGLERWRREVLEVEQRHAAERAERKREEQRIIRARQRAPEPFTEQQTEILGMALAEERAEQHKRVREEIQTAVGELRAEISIAKAHERGGPIIDLPALPLRRGSNAA